MNGETLRHLVPHLTYMSGTSPWADAHGHTSPGQLAVITHTFNIVLKKIIIPLLKSGIIRKRNYSQFPLPYDLQEITRDTTIGQ